MAFNAAWGPSFEKFVGEVQQMAALLVDKGWAEKNAGNLSVNVSHLVPVSSEITARGFLARPFHDADLAGERFLLTGTGVRFRDVAEDPSKGTAVLQAAKDRSGFHILWGGTAEGWAPTSEYPSHLKVHSLLKKSGGRDKAVLHTHPTDLIAMTQLSSVPKGQAFTELLWSMLPEVKMYLPGGARLASYALPGSQALAESTLKELKEGAEAVVWEMHGVLAVGAGPLEAFDIVDVADKAAKVYLKCKAAGETPKGLSAAQLKEIEKGFPPPGPRV
jgi:rhamnulose-1-phosphate aldolase